jgi:hypothetical protein
MKIYNKQSESYVDLEIHSNECFGVFKGQSIKGKVIKRDLDEISIIWKHISPNIIEQYRMVADGSYARKDNIAPSYFDPTMYRVLNPDLWKMNDDQLLDHYSMHGVMENRKIGVKTGLNLKCPAERTRQPIFINHESSLTGAPIFLYDLVTYFKDNRIFSDPIIAEPYPNDLFKSYKINKLYYYNEPALLYSIIYNLDPVFIYSNSINILFMEFDIFEEFAEKTIFHFHESIDNIKKESLKKIKDKKLFVVAERIRKQLAMENCSDVSVFPPFFHKDKIKRIDKISNSSCLSPRNKFRSLDDEKIVVGMSGSIFKRKGFLLFYKTAKSNPDKEFIWIGGSDDWAKEAKDIYDIDFLELDNFFHVPYTKNPYVYLNMLDCFFLTSTDDPCPIVVLESLYLGVRVVAIKGNVFYSHEDKAPDDAYILIEPGSDDRIISNFNQLEITKGKTESGREYIRKNFCSPLILAKNEMDGLLIVDYEPDDDNARSFDIFIDSVNFFNMANKMRYNVIVNLNSKDEIYAKKIKLSILNLKKIFFPRFSCIKNLLESIKHAEYDCNVKTKVIAYCGSGDPSFYDVFSYEFKDYHNTISLKKLYSSGNVFDSPVVSPLAFITKRQNINISILESCEESMQDSLGKMISKNGIELI